MNMTRVIAIAAALLVPAIAQAWRIGCDSDPFVQHEYGPEFAQAVCKCASRKLSEPDNYRIWMFNYTDRDLHYRIWQGLTNECIPEEKEHYRGCEEPA